MKSANAFWLGLIVAGFLMGARGDSPAQGRSRASAGGGEGFERFQLILDRNIFDLNRRPRGARGGDEAEPAGEAREALSLVGSWITNLETLIFVEGNRPGSSGALAQGATIAGWRIAKIEISRAILEKEGRELVWPVGQRIERDSEGEWKVAGAALPASGRARSSSSSTAPASGDAAGAPASAAGSEDLLQRMRERRQRELGQ